MASHRLLRLLTALGLSICCIGLLLANHHRHLWYQSAPVLMRTHLQAGLLLPPPRRAHLPVRPVCIVFVFRHVQKTGGISIRRLFRKLENAGLWESYANGPPWHHGTLRCAPQAGAHGGCSAAPLDPLQVLRGVYNLTASGLPVRAFVEFHTGLELDRYVETLDFVDRELRPRCNVLTWARCNVLTGTLLREPASHYASWYRYNGLRDCAQDSPAGSRCDAASFVSRHPNEQTGLLASRLGPLQGNSTFERAWYVLSRQDLVGSTADMQKSFVQVLCNLLLLSCEGDTASGDGGALSRPLLPECLELEHENGRGLFDAEFRGHRRRHNLSESWSHKEEPFLQAVAAHTGLDAELFARWAASARRSGDAIATATTATATAAARTCKPDWWRRNAWQMQMTNASLAGCLALGRNVMHSDFYCSCCTCRTQGCCPQPARQWRLCPSVVTRRPIATAACGQPRPLPPGRCQSMDGVPRATPSGRRTGARERARWSQANVCRAAAAQAGVVDACTHTEHTVTRLRELGQGMPPPPACSRVGGHRGTSWR